MFTCPLSPLPCYTLSFSTKNNNNFHQTKRVYYMFLSFSNHVAPQGLGFGLPFFLSMLNQLIWLVDPNMIIIPISNMDRACMCCSIWWDRNYKYYILGQKFSPLGCGPIFTLIFQNCHHFSLSSTKKHRAIVFNMFTFSMGCIFMFCCLLPISNNPFKHQSLATYQRYISKYLCAIIDS